MRLHMMVIDCHREDVLPEIVMNGCLQQINQNIAIEQIDPHTGKVFTSVRLNPVLINPV